MRSKGDIEPLLMIVGGVILLLIFGYTFSQWKVFKEAPSEPEKPTGCAGDDSKCTGNEKGSTCIEISKNEYVCGCKDAQEHCPQGKTCKKERGSDYGFCE